MDSSFDSIDTILYLYNAEGVNWCQLGTLVCQLGTEFSGFLAGQKATKLRPQLAHQRPQMAPEWLLDGI